MRPLTTSDRKNGSARPGQSLSTIVPVRNIVVDREASWQHFIKWSISESPASAGQHEIIQFDADHLFSKIFNNSTNQLVIALMDVRSQRYKYISPNVRHLVGWSYDELMAGGVKFMFDKIHREDVPAAIAFSERINSYYHGLPESAKAAYCGQWDFRVQNREGVHYKYIQKDHVLKHTAEGDIEEYLVFFSRIENYKSNQSQHLLLSDGKENTLYKHHHKTGKTYLLETLSNRELEVIRLISNSFSLNEVAGELGISFNTVKNHSNNILKKLEAKDSMEAVSLMRILGFM